MDNFLEKGYLPRLIQKEIDKMSSHDLQKANPDGFLGKLSPTPHSHTKHPTANFILNVCT